MNSIITRIESIRPSLAAAEGRVASYILAHAADVPLQTVTQVARQAGVSVASVSRFSARMGYPSFRELKIGLARQVAALPDALARETLKGADSDAEIVGKVFAANERSIKETLDVLDYDQLSTVVRRIEVCRRLVFFAAGSSAGVANEAAFRFSQMDIQSEAYAEPQRMIAQAARTARHSVAVGISHSGRTRIVVDCDEVAKGKGAFVVGITNFPRSPLGALCDVVFVAVHPTALIKGAPVPSRLAPLCLIDAMVALVAHRRKALPMTERVNALTDQLLRIPE
jgi:RpiR family transcriptional regulator, carbohydrate utilization regulator